MSGDFPGLALVILRAGTARPCQCTCYPTRPPGLTTAAAMDLTKYVVEYREAAFLLGDYNTYRAQLTRRLRIVQKKLGRATPKNAKYAAKAPVTADDIAKNVEYARYTLNAPRACLG
jgi:hypothetical protein